MDKLKLSFGDRENYTWIINGNTTVCKMQCKVFIPWSCIEPYFNKMNRLFPNIKYAYYGFDFISTGVAKCSGEDEHNEVFGKHLAEARAKQKAYSLANRIICTLYEFISEDLDVMYKFTEDTAYQYTHEGKHINWLITGEE